MEPTGNIRPIPADQPWLISALTLFKSGRTKAFVLYLMLLFSALHSFGQACDCPALNTCGPCTGGLTSLTVEYAGGSLLNLGGIEARDGNNILLASNPLASNKVTFYSVGYPGVPFAGGSVKITATFLILLPSSSVTINTTCSDPIYQGSTYKGGDFIIQAGESLGGGALCCSPGDMPTNTPVFTTACPGNIAAPANSSCEAVVNWTPPAARNNNCGDIHPATLTSNYDPGDTFPLGPTTVTYTATDDYGNTSTCSFSVTVTDNAAPVIPVIANIPVSTGSSSCNAVVSWSPPSATDNCAVTSLTSVPASGSTFAVGTTPVTYTATDAAGNSSQRTFNVIVTDNTAPVIPVISNITVPSTSSSCDAVVSWSPPSATDNCAVTSLTSVPASGSTFTVGTTLVTYTATDAAGNSSQRSFNVIVTDNTAPVIPVIVDIPVSASISSCDAVVSWSPPAATDNCAVTSLTSVPASGSTFAIGTTQVTYTATDAAGNSSQRSFNVIVTDNTAPVIPVISNITVPSASSSCDAVVSWSPPAATDNCAVTSLTSVPASGSTFTVGTTLVTYTATDAAGNSSQRSFNVIVTDNTSPIIPAMADIPVSASISCDVVVSWSDPAATDNCAVTNLTSVPASGSTFPVGTTLVTYTATDAAGNSSQRSFNVIVTDNTAPIIPVITDLPVSASISSCDAVVNWSPPAATDNCAVTSLTSIPASGSTFALGTTLVTYTATDAAGNSSQRTFNVIVTDNIAPVIPVIADIPVSASISSCDAVVSWSPPAATDNCAVTSLTSVPASGSTFAVGTTQVTYTAIDAAGNSSQRTFNVIVTDNTVPIIPAMADIPVSASISCDAIVSWTPPAATDNCAVTSLTSVPASGSTFPVGTTLVTYTATDAAGNSSQRSFNVIVTDNTAPIIPVITDLPVSASISSCDAVVNWSPPAATDNCAVTSLTSVPASGSTFALGTTLVTYTATDAAGNSSQRSFNVIVTDNTAPVIPVIADLPVSAGTSSCDAVVSWSPPAATDNCAVTSLTSIPASGSTFGIGTTLVTYIATDAAGNSSQRSFNVIVTDNTVPVISAMADIPVSASISCDAIVSWTPPAATDNCAVTSLTSIPASGSTFAVGTTPVTYTAIDAAGNSSQRTFNVIVTDNTVPVIPAMADIPVSASISCDAIVSWTPPAATDNCAVTSLTSVPASGSTFVNGTTLVTYTATDAAGNSSQRSFNVIVTDNTAPIIPAINVLTVPTDPGRNTAVANFPDPAATDNCGIATTVSNPLSGSTFTVGTTPVTFTVTDIHGNTATKTFNVIVEDHEDPVIPPISNLTTSTDPGLSTAVVHFPVPAATDNCGIATNVSNPLSGSSFVVGSTPVIFTVTDINGNTATETFDVIVEDHENPTITNCPSNITQNTDPSACGKIISWPLPTASDNCAGVSLFYAGAFNRGDEFPVGTTTVSYTATDASGNSVTCTFDITIVDDIDPQFTICSQQAIEVNADPSVCSAVVTWVPPAATDNCSVTLSSLNNSGDTFPIGTTQITYTATDPAGNTATCSFNVIVNDVTVPTLTAIPDVTVSTTDQCGANVTWTAPSVSDCTTFTLGRTHQSGDFFPIGTTEVTYTASDNSGNSSECKFKITVEDKTPPDFRDCIPEVIAFAFTSCQANVTWTEPKAIDECGLVASVIRSHSPGDLFPIGTTVVTYTATDSKGNTSSCTFNVVVKDGNTPVISGCPDVVTAKANESGEVAVSWTEPIATTGCGEVSMTRSHSPGDIFSIGSTEVNYEATDGHGITTVCRFDVVVSFEDVVFDVARVITPDGDGINDIWLLGNIQKFARNKVMVVDRWGGVVYSASGYNNEQVAWDGANRSGALVPTGTYFFTISVYFRETVVEKKGFIELIR